VARQKTHYDDEPYEDDHRHPARRPPLSLTQRALDWGMSGSIMAILVLTILYTFSPLDSFPVAGQVDDLAAILAGGGSILFLTIMRFVLHTRVGRWGCVIVIALTALGAFVIFWALMKILGSVF
jgi:hypothetical protein